MNRDFSAGPLHVSRYVGSLAVLLLLFVAGTPVQTSAQDSQPSPAPQATDAERQKAIDLFQQNKFEEALPLFEELALARPNDAAVEEMLGGCLVAHAVNLPDAEQRRQTRLRARKAFLRAQELGDKSGYVTVALAQIPEDGADVVYSPRAEVDSAMREAEAAFSRGDFPGAIAGYAQVLKLDPSNYDATLFTGDVYFKEKDYDNSCSWFEKAVALDPNRETAYRYWGDAIYRSGKDDQAQEKYVLAIVAEPYNKAPWVGLLQWAQRNHYTLTQPNIQTPAIQTTPDGKTNFTLDINMLGKNDGSDAWIVYGGTRTIWATQKFKQHFPDEKEYRHSLPEESDALSVVASYVSEKIDGKKLDAKDLNPQLAVLLKLKQEDLLDAYILISHPDKGIAQDYAAYRAAHRDKLIQYMHEYILPHAN